jgi:two-component system, LuxR family, response regulator FixJ
MERSPTVYVVDDDRGARQSMRWLLESAQMTVETFDSGPEFLASLKPNMAGCALLDLRMPGMSGLELQEHLATAGCTLPIIFLTGHGDLPVCVRAFRSGAFDFLQKPVNDHQLLDSVQAAIERDREQRERALQQARSHESLQELLAPLTDREREVVPLLLAGQTIKQVAGALAISFQTAAKHRTRALEKLKVANEVELLRLVSEVQNASELVRTTR